MKRFELPEKTWAKITKVTPRKEFAGDDRRQAISLRIQIQCNADKLGELHPNLQDMLFWRPPQLEAQQQLDGIPETKPNLRAPLVKQPLHLELEFSGYTLNIEHGADDDLELYQCELGKFDVEGIEGGACMSLAL